MLIRPFRQGYPSDMGFPLSAGVNQRPKRRILEVAQLNLNDVCLDIDQGGLRGW